MRSFKRDLVIVFLFAVAMGIFESIVVVYLWEIYYPDGFAFPLPFPDFRIFRIELVREFTTLVMLISVGLLLGKSRNGKFAWFLLVFGIWDIIYYVGLKLFLGWPFSLLTWDILFLIPVVWVGPVLAPLICALTMVVYGLLIGWNDAKGITIKLGKKAWVLMIGGAILVFYSFIEEFTLLLIENGFFSVNVSLRNTELIDHITSFVPQQFNWWIFGLGELFILIAFVMTYRKYPYKT